MKETKIQQIINEIADTVFPPERQDQNTWVVSGRNPCLRNLLTEFVLEIKRAAIEGEF